MSVLYHSHACEKLRIGCILFLTTGNMNLPQTSYRKDYVVHFSKQHFIFTLTLALVSCAMAWGVNAETDDAPEMSEVQLKSTSKGEGVQVRSQEDNPFVNDGALSAPESEVSRPDKTSNRAQMMPARAVISPVIVSEILLDSMFAIGPIFIGNPNEELTVIAGGPNSYSQSVSVISGFSSPGFSGSVPALREVSHGGGESAQPGGMLGWFLDSFLKGVEQQEGEAQSDGEFDWILEDVSSASP